MLCRGFVTGNGNRVQNSSMVGFGAPCMQGDVIRICVDLDQRTMEVRRNGASLGTMYSDVTGPVRAAMTMVMNQQVQLRMAKGA
jgi:hypothetical protein